LRKEKKARPTTRRRNNQSHTMSGREHAISQGEFLYFLCTSSLFSRSILACQGGEEGEQGCPQTKKEGNKKKRSLSVRGGSVKKGGQFVKTELGCLKGG